MTGYLWAIFGFVAGLGLVALGDMVSEEVRDRLDHLPHALLRLAALRLDPALRVTVYEDEWLPELTYILKGDEARPVTRLIHGLSYALGILANTHRITRNLDRAHMSAARPRVSSATLRRTLGLVAILGTESMAAYLHLVPAWGLVTVDLAVSLIAPMILISTILFGSNQTVERAFRMLRWLSNRPEPPAPRP